MLSGLIGGEVAHKDGMFGFAAHMDNGGGVVSNCGVGWWTGRNGERGTPCGGIACCWLDEANEVVCAILIIGDIEEEGIEDVPESDEIVVAWLVSDVLEHHHCCGK